MAISNIFTLNGNITKPPRDWDKLSVIATFDGNNLQPRITTSDLEFVNENAKIIRDYRDGGLDLSTPGTYEGIPFTWQITGTPGSFTIFRGYVDLVNGFKINHPASVSAKIEKDNSILSLQDRLKAITFQSLWDEGIISPADILKVPYVLEPKTSFVEVALMGISTYLMIEKLFNEIRELGKTIADIVAHTTGGITGPAAGLAYSIVVALLQLAFIVLMIITIIGLITDLIALLISPIKFHTATKPKTLVTKALAKIGLPFNTSIVEYDDMVYMPSKNGIDLNNQFDKIIAAFTINQPGIGIPQSKDFGYTAFEMVKLINDAFYARIAILNNEAEQHSLINPFWDQNSTYQLPDVLNEVIQDNAVEIAARRLITFQTDMKDIFTLENKQGFSFEVITEPINEINPKNVLLKGLDDVILPVALANRKNELNPVEKAVKVGAAAADSLINFFGGSSALEAKILSRVGMLKFENDMFDVPRLMRLNSQNKLNANHRDFFSAKYLENNYHVEKSFVRNNFGNQYRIITDQKIPFGFTNFLELIENNRLTTVDGLTGEVDEFRWTSDKDFAVADYRIKQQFTKNLKERFIEPS